MADTPASHAHERAHDESGRPIGQPPPIVFVGGTGRSGTHVRREAARQPPAPGDDPGRGSLSRRGARLSGPARRTGVEGAVRPPPARLLVEGLPDEPDARPLPLRARRAVRARRDQFRGGLRRRPRGARAASSSTTCSGPGSSSPAPTRSSSRAATRWPGADPRPALPRGEVPPRGPRRARRLGLARSPDARASSSPARAARASTGGSRGSARSTRARGRSRPSACSRSASTSCSCSGHGEASGTSAASSACTPTSR